MISQSLVALALIPFNHAEYAAYAVGILRWRRG
jgi:hypothetical protein